MHRIYLPSTGIGFDAPDNVHYHDDGAVRNLCIHSDRLYKRYGIPPKLSFFDLCVEWTGLKRLLFSREKYFYGGHCFQSYVGFSSVADALAHKGEVNFHTYVLDVFDEMGLARIRGHEETHVLMYMGELGQLERALERVDIRARTLRALPEEPICQIGGFYAFIRNFPGVKNCTLKKSTDKDFTVWADWLRENSTWDLTEG